MQGCKSNNQIDFSLQDFIFRWLLTNITFGTIILLVLLVPIHHFFFRCQNCHSYLTSNEKKRLDTANLKKKTGALPPRPVDWYQHHGLLHDQHLPGFFTPKALQYCSLSFIILSFLLFYTVFSFRRLLFIIFLL